MQLGRLWDGSTLSQPALGSSTNALVAFPPWPLIFSPIYVRATSELLKTSRHFALNGYFLRRLTWTVLHWKRRKGSVSYGCMKSRSPEERRQNLCSDCECENESPLNGVLKGSVKAFIQLSDVASISSSNEDVHWISFLFITLCSCVMIVHQSAPLAVRRRYGSKFHDAMNDLSLNFCTERYPLATCSPLCTGTPSYEDLLVSQYIVNTNEVVYFL